MGLQPAPNDAVRIKASTVMNRIGTGLLKQCKLSQDDGKGNKSPRRKDMLSLLVHANTAEAEAQRLSDEDVLSRVYQVV